MKPSRLTVTKTMSPKELPASKSLLFGRTFVSHFLRFFMCRTSLSFQSDHMLKIRWTEATGWEAPSIEPCKSYRFLHSFYRYLCSYVLVGPIGLSPSATVLHYAQSLFEGMKAYRHEDGTVTMFRPDMNMKRMNSSAKRLALPVRSIILS